MLIQPRDVKLLQSLFCHRYLTSEHLHALHFEGRSLRAVQARLKELHDDKYLDRTYVMPPIDGTRRSVRPLYSIARRGAAVLAPFLGVPLHRIPHTREANRVGYEYLLHELVVADSLVSAEVTFLGQPGVRSVETLRDHDLRSRVAVARQRLGIGEAVAPDGALTIDAETLPSPTTVYLEVVHVGVKGGNRHLVDKLERYARLLRAGFFARVLGHSRVRALIVVSPSEDRIDNLRVLAARVLVHGRRFVWFAAAPRHSSRTHPPTTFTRATLATTEFVDVEGDRHHLDLDDLR